LKESGALTAFREGLEAFRPKCQRKRHMKSHMQILSFHLPSCNKKNARLCKKNNKKLKKTNQALRNQIGFG
jgi:hypothetical protein